MAVAEISAAVTSIRAALDIAKAMSGLRDAEAFRSKSIELQAVVLEAMEKAIASREAQEAQSGRIRDLEAELARLRSWENEKARYKLKDYGSGTFAYELDPAQANGEPIHRLCPNCFNMGKKAILQFSHKGSGTANMFDCKACNQQFILGTRAPYEPPEPLQSDYY